MIWAPGTPRFTCAGEMETIRPIAPEKRWRRPQAMCHLDNERVAIANSRGNSISIVNVMTGQLAEFLIGDSPQDVIWLQHRQQLGIVTSENNNFLLATLHQDRLTIERRFPLGRGAARLAVSGDESLIAVSSIWDREVALISVADTLQVRARCQLPFEPKLVCFSADQHILLALDAFAGQMAAINVDDATILGRTELLGHHFGGVILTGKDRFVVTHQILHADAATTGDNIAAGRVIENVAQEILLTREDTQHIKLEPQVIRELGVPSHGAADPTDLAVLADDMRAVALEGVDEVALITAFGLVQKRISVGNRPVDLLSAAQGKELYVLNFFSESISVIDLVAQAVVRTISLGPTPTPNAQERGAELFFDGHLSRFGWFSCQSCHVGGHTNGQLSDTFGDNSAGAPKRVLSLLGGRDNNPWAWNGSMRSLHDQVFKSGETTMRGPGFSARETNSLVAYLHTLEKPPVFRPARDDADQVLIEQGRQVFQTIGCAKCHVPPLTYTSDTVYDVGLIDEHGQRKFNPPSLNGVGYRRAFFHDGRAKRLTDVFIEYGHQLNDALTQDELKALLRFLESL